MLDHLEGEFFKDVHSWCWQEHSWIWSPQQWLELLQKVEVLLVPPKSTGVSWVISRLISKVTTGALGIKVVIASCVAVTSRVDFTTRALSTRILTELFSAFVLTMGLVVGANPVSLVVIVTALAAISRVRISKRVVLISYQVGK